MMQLKALFSKEVKEAFRDKRALLAAFGMAFMAPIMLIVMSEFCHQTIC